MARGSRPRIEPVPDAPAATVDLGADRALVIGDYHAGIEAGLRYERGVELPSDGPARRQRLLELLRNEHAARLVVLGDLGHRIGSVDGAEREELDSLYKAVVENFGARITVAPGNHDGGLEGLWGDLEGVDILPQAGGLLGDADRGETVGVCHGHTWPAPELLSAEVICMAHEHPTVKLTDSVGGYRTEKAWLRGRLDRDIMAAGVDADPDTITWGDPELVVVPSFNDRSGGTWVNVESEGFLSPFLPEALVDADCYLLDGTRLGAYNSV
ncbi:metallophosphoesterase [Halohasta litorea]|uniref:Metallophosphoesterase n=1 Tax=Halohasta litorea TaxID=869891 RepID=A0ABD6D601_9EURY|nr:metallophosphoesterase [Halohasta litorea]